MRQTKHTVALLRFNLRADWAKLLTWLLAILVLVLAVGFKFDTIYGSETALQTITVTLKSASMVVLLGAFDLPVAPTVAQVFGSEMLLFTSFVIIAMNLTIGITKTRGDEDLGLTELIRSRDVGPQSPLLSTATELILLNSVLTLLMASGLSIAKIPGASSAGNWIFSLGLGLTGLAFGMMGLLVAQLTSNHTSATILAYTLFLVSYLIRMVTDTTDPDLTWWSPLGWLEKTQPAIQNNWWALLPMVVMAGLCYLVATELLAHRDLGRGLLATRPGRRTASRFLNSPFTLIWRLNRTLIACWLVGSVILGATYGSIFNSIGDVLKSNPTVQKVFGVTAVHSANHAIIVNYTAIILLIIAALACLPAIQLVLHLKRDEQSGTLELIYAHQTSRLTGYYSTILSGMIVGLITYWAGVCGLILTGNQSLSAVKEQVTQSEFGQALLVGVPIVLGFTALASLLVGGLPKLVSLSWVILGYGFVTIYLGALLKLPDWAKQLTPFDWQPKVPISNLNQSAFWLAIAGAIGLVIFGELFYQRRDLQLN
ncbi:ABC transporter permease [uncultured Secundilactobacillus sp.]|uniref:ABC transporter permease n=1 Tax=uncultured Secundilactobacillus sp. TaxID=2813935 RepID=UPI00258E9854|nr:permease [uncultured Secundilactobacillus sp.]